MYSSAAASISGSRTECKTIPNKASRLRRMSGTDSNTLCGAWKLRSPPCPPPFGAWHHGKRSFFGLGQLLCMRKGSHAHFFLTDSPRSTPFSCRTFLRTEVILQPRPALQGSRAGNVIIKWRCEGNGFRVPLPHPRPFQVCLPSCDWLAPDKGGRAGLSGVGGCRERERPRKGQVEETRGGTESRGRVQPRGVWQDWANRGGEGLARDSGVLGRAGGKSRSSLATNSLAIRLPAAFRRAPSPHSQYSPAALNTFLSVSLSPM